MTRGLAALLQNAVTIWCILQDSLIDSLFRFFGVQQTTETATEACLIRESTTELSDIHNVNV